MSMIGDMKFFLGLQVHQPPRGIFVCQSQYTIDILKKYRMEKCDTISTPMATTKLDADLQDVDHAGCNDDCKSTSGGIQFLGDKLVSWSLQKQDYTSMSNAEADYHVEISNEETIDSGFTQFNAIITSLKSLDPDYFSKNHVRKFLLAPSLKWRAKVTAIEEAKYLATIPLDELVGNLKIYEMILENDRVVSKTTTKDKVKSLALKAKVTR
ncbi:UBN2 domain-containing protein [Tanacetum coccineum]|uniref:UBN2 domain-containing protein n=1 Tax=Tanacetum coccineum TaxID=301880 RepID=A0ABQ4WL91_9ASTR